ncbi:MAG: MFS transporter, partial [Peptococcaceae bacterium]|nr:MFS transporter [Peptococcaceae bacterium]
MATAGIPAGDLEAGVQKKRFMRIIPYIFVLYIISFLDRVNVGYAALAMNNDLGFSSAVYGLGAGIFFIGYFIMEIPGNLIMARWSARLWL